MNKSKMIVLFSFLLIAVAVTFCTGCAPEKLNDRGNPGMSEGQRAIIQEHKKRADNVN